MANFNQHLSEACKNYRSDKYRSFSAKNAESKFLHPIGLSIKNLPSVFFINNQERFNYSSEKEHFEALHFIKYQTHKCLLNGKYRLNNWSALYFGIRNRIISANIALLYTCLEKTKISYDFEVLKGLGHDSLIRAAEGFDPWRGYRFSTYACNSIYRAFYRVLDRQKMPMINDFDVDNHNRTGDSYLEHKYLYIECLQRILNRNEANMSPPEKTVIKHRFGLNKVDTRKLTLHEIGDELSISKERVRQIQESALKKLKLALAHDPVLQ